MYKDLKAENIKLKQTIEIMRQASMGQGQAIGKLKQSVAELKRRLYGTTTTTPRRHKKRGRGGQTQRRMMIKIMEIINPQKRVRGRTARTRPAARNRAGGKRATRAKPAGQNPQNSRSTPRTPAPSAARTTSP